jgi:hypothetical protein
MRATAGRLAGLLQGERLPETSVPVGRHFIVGRPAGSDLRQHIGNHVMGVGNAEPDGP